MPLRDTLQRPLRNLRLSVTDRCNLRCSYCMPEEEYAWLPRSDILSFEELARVVDAFSRLGVHKLRLTGGEPLLRRDLPRLVGLLRENERLDSVAMTTNGILLAGQVRELHAAGLERLNVSLDSLRPERVAKISRRDCLPAILRGIESVREAGFEKTKIDTVVMRGVNDDELIDLVEFGKRAEVEVRFIEYMDVGGATRWSMDTVVSRTEMLERLGRHYGELKSMGERNSAPADRYALPDGTIFGIISSTTQPFCSACDRARLTADGTWYMCLYATNGKDLRAPLRAGASADDLVAIISEGWSARADRGAEERLEQEGRSALVGKKALKVDPRLEMHTRGG
jgi:cyclic pyranopterin phosphate synthase